MDLDGGSLMSLGPILIFDKSMLQRLNVDEAVWLDNMMNMTPLLHRDPRAPWRKR